jgi:hypothetical protein
VGKKESAGLLSAKTVSYWKSLQKEFGFLIVFSSFGVDSSNPRKSPVKKSKTALMRKSRKRSQSSSSLTEVLRTRKTILPLPQFRSTLPSIKMPGQFLRNLCKVGQLFI